jgi:hypothetical protein
MPVIMMHVAGPKFNSVFSFCFFSALRRGWVRRHLALGLVQNRRVVRSQVFAASAALGTRVGLSLSGVAVLTRVPDSALVRVQVPYILAQVPG